jgi:hypothetical protein
LNWNSLLTGLHRHDTMANPSPTQVAVGGSGGGGGGSEFGPDSGGRLKVLFNLN